MKVKLFIACLLMLCALVLNVNAQSCPTGNQECYTWGSLSGADKESDATQTSQYFEVTSGVYCPSARINCANAPQRTYRVLITRIQGTGTITAPGMVSNPNSPAFVDFPLEFCGSTGSFSILAVRTAPGTAKWEVKLQAFFGSKVCDSGIYYITLTD